MIFDGVGLNITVLSYLDRLDFGIVADRDQIADLWRLINAFRRAFEELDAALGMEEGVEDVAGDQQDHPHAWGRCADSADGRQRAFVAQGRAACALERV